jgi:cytidine deaminase
MTHPDSSIFSGSFYYLTMIFFQAMENSFMISDQEDLDPESRMLIEKAEEALQNAYAPYSKFRVATALLLDSNTIVTGTNQENAAYPDGMCAERVALFSKASQYPTDDIRKLVVIAKGEDSQKLSPATCCGSCRQVMLEFEQRQGKTFEVIMLGNGDKWIKAPTAESLLPFSFTKKNLQHAQGK